jgi:hypothetical protein
MSASEWEKEMERLEREISKAWGHRKGELKAQYYDAEKNYKKALGKEAKAGYQSAGWF